MKKIIILLFTSLALTIVSSADVRAVSSSEWRAGRIIDDSIFLNYNALSIEQIHNFLSSKVSCDTWGIKDSELGGGTRAEYGAAHGNPAPFTCLPNYYENTDTLANNLNGNPVPDGAKSAAHIIWDASQRYKINPKVLIVLLQKEQGLVTDEWPFTIQYRSATGYACPDTAPCDTQYYGFYNQVESAAWQFKRYLDFPSTYNHLPYQTNAIRWSPNSACGSSNVYIENRATAALYNYTPYQPNQSALTNLYGSGDSCGAYGNRNFWRYYNDWFGPSIGPLVRTLDDATLYYSDGTNRYRAGSMQMVAEYGLGLQDVRLISQQEMDLLPLATTPNKPELRFVTKSNDDTDSDLGAIYLISNGMRYHITSMELFNDFGFTIDSLGSLPIEQLERMPIGGVLSNFVQRHDGFIYNVSSGTKKGIFDLETYNSLNPSGHFTRLSSHILDSIATSAAVTQGKIILKNSNSGELFLVTSSGWHTITSMQTYSCLGGTSLKNFTFDSSRSIVGTTIGSASCLSQKSTGEQYILNGNNKLPIRPEWGISSPPVFYDDLIDRLPTLATTPTTVLRDVNGHIYSIEEGRKRHIVNMTSFTFNNYTIDDIVDASSGVLATLPIGAPKLSDSALIMFQGSKKVYFFNNNTKLLIPSVEIFRAYNFNWTEIVTLDIKFIDSYPTSGELERIAFTPSATIFDKGTAIRIPDALLDDYNFSSPPQPTYPSLFESKIIETRTATQFIKSDSSTRIYLLENGYRRPILTWSLFLLLGGAGDNITVMSEDAILHFPIGSSMEL